MLTRWWFVVLLRWAWCVERPSGLHKSNHGSPFSFFSCLTPASVGISRFPVAFGDPSLPWDAKGVMSSPCHACAAWVPKMPGCGQSRLYFFCLWGMTVFNQTRSQLGTGILKHCWFLLSNTTKGINAAYFVPLFSFFSLLFLRKSEPLGWFKFFLGSSGLTSWLRGFFAALSWSWLISHINTFCSLFLLWKWKSSPCVDWKS